MDSDSFKTRVAGLVAILLYVGAASADQRGYSGEDGGAYLGAGLSRVTLDAANNPFSAEKFSDTGFKTYLGYAASELFRVELGYVDFGDFQLDPGPGFQSVDLGAHGTTLSAEMALPLAEDLAVFAKAGLMFWEADGRVGGFGLRENGDDPFFGVGMRFRLAPNLDVTGAFERYQLADTDVDVSSLGLALRF
jgi:OOP family OmpA-OmpF porin